MDESPDSGEFLTPILQALAESLDVRDIFARISVEARRIVPHDFLLLGLLSSDHEHVTVIALSGELAAPAGEIPIPVSLRSAIEEGTFTMSDVQKLGDGKTLRATMRLAGHDESRVVEYPTQPLYDHMLADGYRSFLRVAVRLRGALIGGLIFCSRSREGFAVADFARARPIADCVALAVAHQRLAEEQKRAAEARERAAQLEVRVQRLNEELDAQGRHRTLGHSGAWRDVLHQAAKVAATEATVLLTGESGTGKEVIARFIHRASPRADGPFIAINCAALPEQLLESELFGHERGAFTGALSQRVGKIEQAGGGVLFLDEVAEMSPAVQAKLLRVLQEREFQRLGGTRTIKADTRVIAATHRNLKAGIAQGTFREDLYYRLAVIDLPLPPLRERAADIAELAEAFVKEISEAVGRPALKLAPDALERLRAYAWPGNVRELHNVIERAVILCDGDRITAAQLPRDVAAATAATTPTASVIDSSERQLIVDALTRAGNNKSKAARLLGMSRAQLRSRIEKHGIDLAI